MQITTFPPQAAILRWRGAGDFRETISLATDVCTALVMHAAQRLRKHEIFPDESAVVTDGLDLRDYLREVAPTYTAYEETLFDLNAPELTEQSQNLAATPREVWRRLFSIVDNALHISPSAGFPHESGLHKAAYDTGVIFDFRWMDWHEGKEQLKDNTHLESRSPLELSIVSHRHFSLGQV